MAPSNNAFVRRQKETMLAKISVFERWRHFHLIRWLPCKYELHGLAVCVRTDKAVPDQRLLCLYQYQRCNFTNWTAGKVKFLMSVIKLIRLSYTQRGVFGRSVSFK